MINLATAWQRLAAVSELSFTARSQAAVQTGWNGTGVGRVEVSLLSPQQRSD